MRGKLINFEGIDSSGKKTQSNLLAERLRKEGKTVEIIRFPTYQKSPLGVFVSKYLKGDFGSKEEITPEIGSIFYSLDRYQFKKQLNELLDKGTIIIADRYTPSNIFQAAKLDGENRFVLWDWIKALDARLPKQDAVIVLNVPTKVSKNASLTKEQKNELMKDGEIDIHEEDSKYQEKVRRTYLEIAERENWIIIECFEEKNGKISFRDANEIHEEIYQKLKDKNVI